MNKETIDETIKHRGVYEIKYKKGEDIKTHLISNIAYSPKYGDSCIQAYSHKTCKELTFSIRRIQSIQEYWIGILSKDTMVPKTGLYLIARAGHGQGIDIEYELLILKEGYLFENKEISWDKPIAYHYIPSLETPESNWIEKEITLKKGGNEHIPAPEKGIPIIAYRGPHKENESIPIEYCFGIGNGDKVWHGINENDDVSTGLKDIIGYEGFGGWSERWDGYKILGFLIVMEYDCIACHLHIEQRLKVEPNFLFD